MKPNPQAFLVAHHCYVACCECDRMRARVVRRMRATDYWSTDARKGGDKFWMRANIMDAQSPLTAYSNKVFATVHVVTTGGAHNE